MTHAAVVARGMGTCCVTGCESLTVNEETKQLHCGPQVILEGTIISVDGSTGKFILAKFLPISADNNDDLQELLSWADAYADLTVRANAETQDLETAIRFGAAGIGLARTEHMFFGEERVLEMRRLILAESEKEATYVGATSSFSTGRLLSNAESSSRQAHGGPLVRSADACFCLMKRMIFNYWRSNYNGSQ